jgi:hypothetical protein
VRCHGCTDHEHPTTDSQCDCAGPQCAERQDPKQCSSQPGHKYRDNEWQLEIEQVRGFSDVAYFRPDSGEFYAWSERRQFRAQQRIAEAEFSGAITAYLVTSPCVEQWRLTSEWRLDTNVEF